MGRLGILSLLHVKDPNRVRDSERRDRSVRAFASFALVAGLLALGLGALATLQAAHANAFAAPTTASPALLSEAKPEAVEIASVPYDLAQPIVAGLLLVGAVGVRLAWRSALHERTRWAFGGLFAGLLALALGSFATEWAGAEALGPTGYGLAFMVQVMGLAATAAGAAGLGWLSLRARTLPPPASIALLAAPGAFIAAVVFPGAPWGGLIWIGATWIAVGIAFVRPAPPPPEPDSRRGAVAWVAEG